MRRLVDWFTRTAAALTTRRALAIAGACLASAVLLRVSFPVPGWWPLAWVALVPWFVVLRTASGREAMWGSVAMGMAAAGLGLSWQFLVTIMGGTGLAIYVGLYYVLFAWLVRATGRRFRVPFVVAAPAVWVGVEYLRSFALTGLPWYFVGHTQVPFRALVQVSDLLGAYALSFLVVASNALVTEVVLGWRTRPRPWVRLAASGAFVAVLVGGALGYGAWRLPRVRSREGPLVGIVQANIPQEIKNRAEVEDIFVKHWETTRRLQEHLAGQQPDLVVWPESMVQLPLNRVDLEGLVSYRRALVQITRRIGCPLLVGAYAEVGVDRTVVAEADGEVRSVTDGAVVVGDREYLLPHYADPVSGEKPIRRIHVREGDQVKAGDALAKYSSIVHNSAYLVRRTGGFAPADRYDKNHLVPFGEYVPIKALLFVVRQVVPFAKGFTPGSGMNLMKLGGARFGTLICFEDVFPYLVRRLVVREDGGADFLINISNDGWFKGSHELDQHLAMCRLRAVEFRTGIVRCCNTGISAIIAPDGSMHAMVRDARGRYKDVEGVAVGRVRLRDEVTFYARHGDILGRVCLGFAALVLLDLLLSCLLARLRHRRCKDGVCPV